MQNKAKIILISIGAFLLVIALIILILFIIYKSSTPENENSNNTEDKTVTAYIFRRDNCPYCENAIEYFLSIEELFPYLEIKAYEVSDYPANRNLMNAVSQELGIETRNSVPLIVIGSYSLRGFSINYRETLNNEIAEAYQDANYEDIVKKVIEENNLDVEEEIITKN